MFPSSLCHAVRIQGGLPRGRFLDDAGVIDDDVESAECHQRCIERFVPGFDERDVAGDCDDFPVRIGGGDLRCEPGVDVHDDHLGTFSHIPFRDCCSGECVNLDSIEDKLYQLRIRLLLP